MPKPLLYALGAVFILAAGWFIYADKVTAVAGKAPAAATSVKK